MMSVIGDDPFMKGPVRYMRICEKSSSIRSFIQLGQEIQTRQERLSPDLKAGWRQMGQPYQGLPRILPCIVTNLKCLSIFLSISLLQ